MPTYVYRCAECGTDFEAAQKFSDNPLTACPQGHEGVKRVITPAGIIFKGSGWYIKDSKASTTGAASNSQKSDKSEKSEGGEKAESKESAKESDTSTSDTSEKATTSESKPASTSKTEAA